LSNSTETPSAKGYLQVGMTELAEKLADIERGQIVDLTGYPDEGESEWHVNAADQVAAGANRRLAIILQAADVGEHWITVAVEREGGEWTIGDFAAFEGKPPSGGGDEAAIPLDQDEVDLVRIER